jgi:hypothetical protein
MGSYGAEAGQGFTVGMIKIVNGITCGKRADVSTVAVGSIATVLTPTSGMKFRLLGGDISVSTGASVLFEDNSHTTANFIYRSPALVAGTPFHFELGDGFLSSTADNVLKATGSTTTNLSGTLYYSEE